MSRAQSLFAGVVVAGAAFAILAINDHPDANPAGAPAGAVVSTTMTEQECEARPRLYDTDRKAYYKLLHQVMARQGISSDHWWLYYQLDHLIPWGLCGADGLDNEWLQSLEAAHRKDVIEHEHEEKVRRGLETMLEGQDFFRQGRWQ